MLSDLKPTTTVSNILAAYDYYPFGMMARKIEPSNIYRYGFNGQEKDDEIEGSGNSYDFGARIYDPRLGKFLSIDKYTGKFPYFSPYQFAGNSPLCNVDINGDSIYFVTEIGTVFAFGKDAQGDGIGKKFGRDILLRTQDGKALLNKYEKSTTHDIYVSIKTIPTVRTSRGEGNPGAMTLNSDNMGMVIKNGKFDFTAIGENPENASIVSGLSHFQGIKVKHPRAKNHLLVLNQDYLNKKGIFSKYNRYDMAESFFHEIKSHIDLMDAGDGAAEHSAYGVEHDNNLGIVSNPNHLPIVPGSFAEKIVNQIKDVVREDEFNKMKDEIQNENKPKAVSTGREWTGSY